MRWQLRRVAVVLICGAAALQAAFGQSAQAGPAESAPTIKVQVNQVLVPVIVTDRKGHYVTGLKESDFQVLEDGRPQTVVAFSTEQEGASRLFLPQPESGAAPAPPPGPAPAGEPGARTYLVCLDALNSSFGNFNRVRSSLRKLFKRQEAGGSEYALVALGRLPTVVQDLTRDPAAVLEALKSKELQRAIEQSEKSNLREQRSEILKLLEDYCRRCPCMGARSSSSGDASVCSGYLRKIEMWARGAADERNLQTVNFLRNLRALVERLGTRPGKRTLILISDGFSEDPGQELFSLMADYVQDPGLLLGNATTDARTMVEEILRSALARNVTFYTLDSRGLYIPPAAGYDASSDLRVERTTILVPPAIEEQKEMQSSADQDALRQLAAETGGVFSANSNDLFKGLQQAFADGRAYYLLAYVPDHVAGDAKFHAIEVRVEGKDLDVRAKKGYWPARLSGEPRSR
jgi:VWFA-related protein